MARSFLQELSGDLRPDSPAEAVFWEQLFSRSTDPRLEPIKRLMVAVLEEAFSCLRGEAVSCPDAERAANQARRWLATDNGPGPFSFTTICDVLDLDSTRVREALRRLRSSDAGYRRLRVQSGSRHRVHASRAA